MENSIARAINFITSKDNDKEWVIHSNSDNIKFMIYDKADEVIEELFEDIRLDCKQQWKVVILKIFIYCITNVLKQIWIVMDHI